MKLGLGLGLKTSEATAVKLGSNIYRRTDGTSLYRRPDGTSLYKKP